MRPLVAHLDMDAFYASVEVLDNPTLRGRPVIVGGRQRGVVSSASYEARAWGVHSAMAMAEALRRCPQAVVLPVRMERYRQVSAQVMQITRRFSPVVEQVSIDEAYLEVVGEPWGFARELREAIGTQLGLGCSVGVAQIRALAKVASGRAKPGGILVVEDTVGFIEQVRVEEVGGIGPKAAARLKAMGIKYLGQVRKVGRHRLELALGELGRWVWELAHGRQPRPLLVPHFPRIISHELTLEEDSAEPEVLEGLVGMLSHKLARRARAEGLCGRVVVLKLKRANHICLTRQQSLPAPTNSAREIARRARALMDMLLDQGPFRLVGVGLGRLLPADQVQMGLFSWQTELKAEALERALDEVWQRVGHGAVLPASALEVRKVASQQLHGPAQPR